MKKKPNILLIMTDQQRGDCLSIDGHPDVRTPYLDARAQNGIRFTNAYSPCPVCCPARRSVLTGRSPARDGALANNAWRIRKPDATLPNLLRLEGYQTYAVGRDMHQFPHYARYGFEINEHNPFEDYYSTAHQDLHAVHANGNNLNANRSPDKRQGKVGYHWPHLLEHSMDIDGFSTRPWPYDEKYHETVFSVNKAVECIDRRDQEAPFFMYVGFVAPHPPLIPIQSYFDRYRNRDLTPPAYGNWVDDLYPELADQKHAAPGSGRAPIHEDLMQEAMAGYYALIQHVDAQLNRLFWRVGQEQEETLVIFTSDHGDQLGDHGMFRKCRPYQGSVRIPFLAFSIGSNRLSKAMVIDEPVSLIDILPTICKWAEVDVPDHVEGLDLSSLIDQGETLPRKWVHCESSAIFEHKGFHVLAGETFKYIWFSDTGRELLFDIPNDPKELKDLSTSASHQNTLKECREALAKHLEGRPEGFVEDGQLKAGCLHNDAVAEF